MSEGGAQFPGYAFFFVIGDSQDIPDVKTANLDLLKSAFKQKLGFKWANEDSSSIRNLSRRQWDHKKCQQQDQNKTTNVGQCCIICDMKSLDFTEVEYLMIGICTHGEQRDKDDYIKLSDNSFLFVVDMMDDLNDENFPALKGKKRILVIDSCRHNSQAPDSAIVDGGKPERLPCRSRRESTETDNKPRVEGHTPNDCSQVRSLHRQCSDTFIKTQPIDFLVVYGTTPGRFSYACKQNGSWMLQDINSALQEHRSDTPFNFIHTLTRAADKMSRRESCVFRPDGTKDPDKSGKKCVLFTSNTLLSLPIFKLSTQPLPANVPFH